MVSKPFCDQIKDVPRYIQNIYFGEIQLFDTFQIVNYSIPQYNLILCLVVSKEKVLNCKLAENNWCFCTCISKEIIKTTE